MLEIHLLGECKLVYNGAPVAEIHTSGRLQTILAWLLLHAGQSTSRRHLAFTFWPDSSEKQALTNLRGQLHALRKTLPDADRFLAIDAGAVEWLTDSAYTLDVQQFDDALAAAATPGRSTRDALEEAIDLYRGDLLPGAYDEWILPERERLHQRYLEAVEALVVELENDADIDLAIRYAQKSVQLDPLHEDAYRRLMELHLQNGDRARALRIYHDCVAMLERELGVEPDARTQAVYGRLLKLDAQAEQIQAGSKPERSANALTLVGRQDEWRQLLADWRQAAAGRFKLVLLSGEAGIGKSRLAEELGLWARFQGIDTAQASAYEAAEGLAYAALLDWLRSEALQNRLSLLDDVWLAEVGRLLPDIFVQYPHLPQPPPLTESWQRHRLFEALGRAFVADTQPLLLLLDDLQWSDRETLTWLEYLLHYAPQARLLILATVRNDEVDADDPLASMLQRLRLGGQLSEIPLQPLDRTAAAELADQAAGGQLPGHELEQLYLDTQGNPLFIVEMARTRPEPARQSHEANAAQSGALDAPQPAQPVPLPPKVYAVMQARLARLSPNARTLCALAAAVGRSFSFDLLGAASTLEQDDLMRGLDELWERKILRERQTSALEFVYDFSHDRIRDVAYSELSPMRRRLLHRSVARAMEQVYAASLLEQSAQLAGQWMAAGDTATARGYYRLAGERTAEQFAHDEALRYLKLALDLTQPGEVEELFRLHKLRERIFHRIANRSEQQQALAAMSQLADQLHDEAKRAETEICRAQYAEALGDYEQSESASKAAIARAVAAGRRDLEGQATVQHGFAYWNHGSYPLARSRFERALELAQEVGDRELEGRILLHLGPVYMYCGSYAETTEISNRALAAARAIGDLAGACWAHNQLAFAIVEQGDENKADAESNYTEALRIARAIGDRSLEAKVLNNCGFLYDRIGDYTAAMAVLEQSRHLTRAIGAPRHEAFALNALATTLTNQGAYDQAGVHFQDAWTLFRTIGYRQGEGKVLCDQSLFWTLCGKYADALADAELALVIAQETGVARDQAYAWSRMGYALEGQQRGSDARQAYEAALTLYATTGQRNRGLEPSAGLARLALANGASDQAMEIVAPIAERLLRHRLDATTEALQVTETCHRVLTSVGDPRGEAILHAAHESLQQRAASIEDPARRRAFWQDVPLHRSILAAAGNKTAEV